MCGSSYGRESSINPKLYFPKRNRMKSIQALLLLGCALVSSLAGAETRRTNFDPAKNGFKFVNTFKNNFIGPPVNMQTNGLCGGMSYPLLDYFMTARAPPN